MQVYCRYTGVVTPVYATVRPLLTLGIGRLVSGYLMISLSE